MKYTILGKTGLCISKIGFDGIPIQKVDAGVTCTLMEKLAEYESIIMIQLVGIWSVNSILEKHWRGFVANLFWRLSPCQE